MALSQFWSRFCDRLLRSRQGVRCHNFCHSFGSVSVTGALAHAETRFLWKLSQKSGDNCDRGHGFPFPPADSLSQFLSPLFVTGIAFLLQPADSRRLPVTVSTPVSVTVAHGLFCAFRGLFCANFLKKSPHLGVLRPAVCYHRSRNVPKHAITQQDGGNPWQLLGATASPCPPTTR